jgi:amino acid adenylation domain-containing protein
MSLAIAYRERYHLAVLAPEEARAVPTNEPPLPSAPLVGPDVAFGTATIHARFAEQARLHPQRLALACRDQRLTYAELDRLTNRLAHKLRALGATRGRCVALCLPRSAEMIVALLGILKSGAAYVPLLPDSPPKRLAHQLEETKSVAVVTLAKLEPLLAPLGAAVVRLDRDDLAGQSDSAAEEHATIADDCYVIYTSGSTGLPKGVAVTHGNLANYTTSILGKLAIPADEGWSFATVSTIAADLGHTCIFPSILGGGALHVIDDVLDAAAMARYAGDVGLDVLKITPSHLEALLASPSAADLLPRKVLFTGGEALRWQLVARVRELAPTLRWLNHYGPTETTVGSCTHPVHGVESPQRSATVPIGSPIGNTRCHVLDADGKPVPRNVEGELFIAGAGVSRGYLERPDLTAERFVPEPGRPAGSDARAYRTGDRVKVLDDGAIEFLGRVDFQVKIRGFRIELGEIEGTLLSSPAVREAIVVAHQPNAGEVSLIAYVTLKPGQTASEAELRAFLAQALPPHMMPAHLMVLAALPLNPNGKVDRKALPLPGSQGDDDDAPPVSEATGALEQKLAAVWRELLGMRRIGLDDNFFQIGGSSLAALHLIARIEKELGVKVPHAALIAAPTISKLAALIRRGGDSKLTCLVPLQPLGEKPPFFCIHGGGGHVYFYQDLAKRLGEDQPLYALQARVNEGLPPHETVEEMAEEYLAEIQTLFPQGPYYLGGVSFGGKVALEMAQRLLAQGQTVALLVMFDTWGPGYPTPRPGITSLHEAAFWMYRRIEHHAGGLWLMERDRVLPYLREKAHKAVLETGEAIEEVYKAGARKLRSELGKEERADLRRGESYIKRASNAYVPKPYPGRVILFRCTAQPLGIHYDRAMGWADLIEGGLEIYETPGLHAAMVAEPRTRFLVDKLRPLLDRAQAANRSSK